MAGNDFFVFHYPVFAFRSTHKTRFCDRLLVTFQRGLNARECVLEIRDGPADGSFSDDCPLDPGKPRLFGAHCHD